MSFTNLIFLFAFVEASDPGRYERFVTVGNFGKVCLQEKNQYSRCAEIRR